MSIWKLCDYIIEKKEEKFSWISFSEEGLFFRGTAVVYENADCIVLSVWEDTGVADESEYIDLQTWGNTSFFASVTASGNMKIYSVSDCQEAEREKTADIASKIGCTMKFR